MSFKLVGTLDARSDNSFIAGNSIITQVVVPGFTTIENISITGPTGSIGLQGTSITGSTGSQGKSITGPTGPIGLQGTSITGPTGPVGGGGGSSLVITSITGTWIINSASASSTISIYKQGKMVSLYIPTFSLTPQGTSPIVWTSSTSFPALDTTMNSSGVTQPVFINGDPTPGSYNYVMPFCTGAKLDNTGKLSLLLPNTNNNGWTGNTGVNFFNGFVLTYFSSS